MYNGFKYHVRPRKIVSFSYLDQGNNRWIINRTDKQEAKKGCINSSMRKLLHIITYISSARVV
ncbi:MAG TPA: hypothetical protein VFJ51_13180, partial [Nitrososphaeraceae archaeon]|nr:hypothetical protein [Nitrososphaeraceae archaeon]